MSAQVAADLRAAAEVLRRDGWTREFLHLGRAGHVCHCADGALAIATEAHVSVRFDDYSPLGYTRDKGRDFARWHTARDALQDQLGMSVPDWNDVPGRTADEVIAALEAAADTAEADQ